MKKVQKTIEKITLATIGILSLTAVGAKPVSAASFSINQLVNGRTLSGSFTGNDNNGNGRIEFQNTSPTIQEFSSFKMEYEFPGGVVRRFSLDSLGESGGFFSSAYLDYDLNTGILTGFGYGEESPEINFQAGICCAGGGTNPAFLSFRDATGQDVPGGSVIQILVEGEEAIIRATPITSVPEPSTPWGLGIFGLAGLAIKKKLASSQSR